MTVTYSLNDNVGRVRLLISDKNTNAAVFTDEEITYFLTENGNNINLAAAAALESWAASYAANASSESIGDYSYSQKILDNMLKLAENLRTKDSNTPVMTYAEMDLEGMGEDEL